DDWVMTKFAALRRARADDAVDPRLLEEPQPRQYWGVLTYRQPRDVDAQLVERLALRGETQRLVEALERLRTVETALEEPQLQPSEVAALLDPVSVGALVLGHAVLLDDPVAGARVATYLAEWRNVKPALDGHDLRALGIPRGPVYGEIMRALRAARLDGAIDSRDDELAFVARFLAETDVDDVASS
ncbi:MAG: hypothetical protein KDD83_03915, partial [Caldilineaceae bacterium]|nr:hypothetical protein [Caldilineaceae bacterium]